MYQIVLDHFETFRSQAASIRDGEGLPGFVEQEFRDFLRCGRLAGGFAQFRCGACGLDRLVPISCKGRGFCPSCGGRRMAEHAARLVDHVFPDVPVRQWVLSLPHRLRYRLAWDHDLCRAVVAVYMHAVLGWLRRRACSDDVTDGRGGGAAVIQGFGGALSLNLHIHALVLDGVFARNHAGALNFQPAPRLTALDVAEVLATVEPRIKRLLDRRGLGEGDDGAVRRTTHGRRTHRCWPAWRRRLCKGPWRWRPIGALALGAWVCRYTLRPPVPGDRLRVTDDGQVLLQLRHRWADGTTLVFDPVEFLGRLAVLVPRPRINLLLYYGVLGPRATWRAEIVRRGTLAEAGKTAVADATVAQAGPADTPGAGRGRRWADLMQRTLGLDVLACPACGGRLRLTALIENAAAIDRVLRHLGLPTTIPPARPARAPALPVGVADTAGWNDETSAFHL